MRLLIGVLLTLLLSCKTRLNNTYEYEIREDVLYLNLNRNSKPLLDFKTGEYLDSLSLKDKKRIEKILNSKRNEKIKLSKFRQF